MCRGSGVASNEICMADNLFNDESQLAAQVQRPAKKPWQFQPRPRRDRRAAGSGGIANALRQAIGHEHDAKDHRAASFYPNLCGEKGPVLRLSQHERDARF